jgi:Archaeal/vacuolar-type H+-ATPase subunit E
MDKLQELTQKLYDEGLAKGKQEGEALLQKAAVEADSIVKKAQEEAEAILAKARKDAEDYKVKVEGDVKMAAQQSVQATRTDIENLVVSKVVDGTVDKALANEDYLKGIITAVAQKFSAEEPADLSLVLPESLKAGLEPFVKNELGKLLGKGVEAAFSKKIAGGFKIGPKDGGYFVSLTDDTFKELIGSYLRPATKKLLFG